MKTTKSALLVGASGLVGRNLLQLLLREERYELVRVLVRRSLEIRDPKLREHIVDFDHLDQSTKLLQSDDVFCCLGTTIRAAGSQEAFRKVDFTHVVQTAALASRNGAKQFLLVSSLGANPHSRTFYSRVKGEVEEAVSKLPFSAVHIFRPSFLLGEREERRRGEKAAITLAKLLQPLMIGGWKKLRPVHANTVAAAMVRVAKMEKLGVNVFESGQIQILGSSQDDQSHRLSQTMEQE
jgi:uncharacterized protein YbjT (DUF2867 family)